ncbi:MAG: 2-amino-4-hydroxy-6-hydroxymethyldihydropteridine diphosphokinase [Clostridiales bacterium]|nr:2-amino-4-hydroxy-6-hydroxymethyldihydropteridine diphosphokinase [Clostridiales bacterium]
MDCIKIWDLEVFAYHGVLKEENTLGQKFLICAELYMDVSEAAKEDDIGKSINYANVCKEIDDYLRANTFKLIETMADRLAKHLLRRYTPLKEVSVTIKKPWAPILMPLNTVSVTARRGWHNVYLSLGSNLGDREDYINRAIRLLDNDKNCRVLRVSTLRNTKPVGYEDQDDFINGAVYMQTLLSPSDLLSLIAAIEKELQRERVIRWGPRTIDLDILLYDDEIIQTKDLTIPHIEMAKRKFVLEPMAEIAPWVRHPVLGKTMNELLSDYINLHSN